MFGVVARALFGAETPQDVALLSQGAKANIRRASKKLRDRGATADDVRAWWGRWTLRWPGSQGDRLRPSELTDTWPQFAGWRCTARWGAARPG